MSAEEKHPLQEVSSVPAVTYSSIALPEKDEQGNLKDPSFDINDPFEEKLGSDSSFWELVSPFCLFMFYRFA